MNRRAFALVELVVSVVTLTVLLAVLLPVAHRKRQGDGLAMSLNNLRQITAANTAYYADSGWAALRGARYSSGQITVGWDTWNHGGKNASSFWSSNFEESAYSRPLNAYLYPARIPQPPGYFNNHVNGAWTLNTGTPTPEQRNGLQVRVFKSPGDVETRQRSWPNPTPGLSAYDDVGTSYLINMKWWDMPGLPSSFTLKYQEGCMRIRNLFGMSSDYVYVTDQIGDILPNVSSPTYSLPGEFGKTNASALGFLDGRAEYRQLLQGAASGPGYTFFP